MVGDHVHVLLSVALTSVITRSDDPVNYLVAVLAASVPLLDEALLTPLVEARYLSGPVWTHRSITHSLTAYIAVGGIGQFIGRLLPAIIGYGAHFIPDIATGSTKLFLPFSTVSYGFHLDWQLWSIILFHLSIACIIYEIARRLYTARNG